MKDEFGVDKTRELAESGAGVEQFEGWSFRDAQDAMANWADEQLADAAKTAGELRDQKNDEARNWHQISHAASKVVSDRIAAEREAERLAVPESQKESGRMRSLGSRMIDGLAKVYHPDMFR